MTIANAQNVPSTIICAAVRSGNVQLEPCSLICSACYSHKLKTIVVLSSRNKVYKTFCPSCGK